MGISTDFGDLDRPVKKRLSFDPTINLGHILTMAVMIGSVLTAYSNLDKRITKQEDMAPFVQSAQDEKFTRFQASLGTLSTDLKEVKSAVDKLSLSVQVQSAVSNATKK